MSIYSADVYTPDGRLRGTYVYMLLCQSAVPIYIKVGRSSNPLDELKSIKESCPVEPQAIAIAELPSQQKSVVVERELRHALKPWHSHLAWFLVEPVERPQFNAAWKPVINAHQSQGRPIVWNHYSIPKLIAAAKVRARSTARKFMGRGESWQDFSAVS